MNFFTFVGTFFLRFLLVYMLATLLSNNRVNSNALGTCKVPNLIRNWVRPSFLFSTIQFNEARLIGLIYHCLFSITAPILFIVCMVILVNDVALALVIRDIWFKVAMQAGILFMLISVPIEIASLIHNRRHHN